MGALTFKRPADIIFFIIGGKFYLDYILLTNPVSKNPLIKFVWGWAKDGYTATKILTRYQSCWTFGMIHVVGFFCYVYIGDVFNWWNILANIYPIIVQLYIGYRLKKIINHKNKFGNNK